MSPARPLRLSWAASGSTGGDKRITTDPRFFALLGVVRVRLDRLDAYALATVINGLVKLEVSEPVEPTVGTTRHVLPSSRILIDVRQG